LPSTLACSRGALSFDCTIFGFASGQPSARALTLKCSGYKTFLLMVAAVLGKAAPHRSPTPKRKTKRSNTHRLRRNLQSTVNIVVSNKNYFDAIIFDVT
jgi:hypothetical protein